MAKVIFNGDILKINSLRKLKNIRKELKKANNAPFTLRIVEKRILQIQDEQTKKITLSTSNKIINFFKKALYDR